MLHDISNANIGQQSTRTFRTHKFQSLSFINAINEWMFLFTDDKLWMNPYYSVNLLKVIRLLTYWNSFLELRN